MERNDDYPYGSSGRAGNAALSVVLPAVLALGAFALGLMRTINAIRYPMPMVYTLYLPAAALLLTAHILWERPKLKTACLYIASLAVVLSGLLTLLPVLIRGLSRNWYQIRYYLDNTYSYHGFREPFIAPDLCLFAAHASAVFLIVEAAVKQIRFSLIAAIVMTAAYIGYIASRFYIRPIEWVEIQNVYLAQILLAAAYIPLGLDRDFMRPEKSAPEYGGPVPDETDRLLASLQQMRDSGLISEADYEARRRALQSRR